jgi:O-antigen/teichoic acid export membrane protein
MILRNAAIYTVSSALSSVLPFLLLPILTRELNPNEYGLVSLFTLFSSITGAIFGLSVHGAVNISLFNKSIDSQKYIGTAIGVLAFSTLLSIFILYFVFSWLVKWLYLPGVWLFVAVGMVTAQLLINIVFVIWQVEGQAIKYGSLQIFLSTINLIISLALVLIYKMGWEGRLIGMFVPTYIVSIFCVLYLYRSGKAKWQFDVTYAKDVLKFGVTLIPHSVGYIFITMADRMIISAKLGSHEVGIYMASMQVGLAIGLFSDAVSRSISPWIYKNITDGDYVKKIVVVKITYLYFTVLFIMGISLFILSPYVILLLGEEFRNGEVILAWIGLGSSFSGMYLLVVIYIFFEKKNELLSLITISIGIINLPLSYFMVLNYGAVGGAKSYAFSQLMLFIFVWLVAHKYHPMPWRLGVNRVLSRNNNGI